MLREFYPTPNRREEGLQEADEVCCREVQIGKQLAFLLRARRDIEEGEELGYHYGEDYFTAAGMLCGCAAEAGAHVPRPMPLQVQ
jgi:hypothetical protein